MAIVGWSNIIRVKTGNPYSHPPGLPASLVVSGLQGFMVGWGNYCLSEPSPAMLALMGGAAVGLWHRCRSRRHRAKA